MSHTRGNSLVSRRIICYTRSSVWPSCRVSRRKTPAYEKEVLAPATPLTGLTPIELSMFNEGLQRAIQLEAVCDDCADLELGTFVDPDKANFVTKTNSAGLGTRFNGDQCLSCHNQPALGGSGGFMVPNPQDPPNRYRAPENPMFDLIPAPQGCHQLGSVVHHAIRPHPRSPLC